MKRTSGSSASSNRTSRHVTLNIRRLAVAAVGGAVVVVTAGSQVGAAPVAIAPAAADQGDAPGGTDYWVSPTELPQAATLAAEPGLERAARAVAREGAERTVAAIGAPGEAELTDIPAPALAAYQRAAAVIDGALPSCRLEWELVAAIGRVESDHGRSGGSALNGRGVARPAIVGVPLTGRDGTARVGDSDAGQLDGDRKLDRAVGPMQFLPSTWSVVGVDADGDGRRDPQDIDDAALAAAVYLCGEGENLARTAGQESAVLAYNRSNEYVDTVLALMRAYAQDEPASTIPTASTVQVSGSTAATPDGAAPLAGPAQDAAAQQRRVEREERKVGRDGRNDRAAKDDRGGRGDRGGPGDRGSKDDRNGAEDDVDIVKSTKDPKQPKGPGGSTPAPGQGGAGTTPAPGQDGSTPAPGQDGPGTPPATDETETGTPPATDESETGTTPPESESPETVVQPCPTDLDPELELVRADGTVVTADELIADPALRTDDAEVVELLVARGYDSVTCLPID